MDEHKSMEIENNQQPANDELLYNLPIFINQELNQHLHILQYPHKPINAPYITTLTNIQYKPIQHSITCEYPFIPNTKKNDSFIVDDSNNDTGDFSNMNGIKLVSTLSPNKSNYAVGMIRDNQLHISSVDYILRMLPDITHVDNKQQNALKQRQQNISSNDTETENDTDVTDNEQSNDTQQQDIKPMIIKYKKRESDKTIALRKLTYQYVNTLTNSEPSIPLEYTSQDTNKTVYDDMVERLLCDSADEIHTLNDKQAYMTYLANTTSKQHTSVKRP